MGEAKWDYARGLEIRFSPPFSSLRRFEIDGDGTAAEGGGGVS